MRRAVEENDLGPRPESSTGTSSLSARIPSGSAAVVPERDPFLSPNRPFSDRAKRAIWTLAWITLARFSPRPLHGWRGLVLRAFGARLGASCHIYPGARIWAPWNLVCADVVTVGDGAEIYNPSPITLESHAIVSQGAFLCGASHDHGDPTFPMISAPIRIGPYAWIGARAIVRMGTSVGEGAILGLGSVATRDLDPWSIYAGNPARRVAGRTAPHKTGHG